MSAPVIEVEQTSVGGFVVSCSVHGRITPAPGKIWTSHVAAGMAATSHALFTFHGKGAR